MKQAWAGSGTSWTTCKSSALHSVPAPDNSFFTGWMLFLMPNRQRKSTEHNTFFIV